MTLRVIKFGGNDIDDPVWLERMVTTVHGLCQSGMPPIIVHGGGKEIGRLQTALGGQPVWVAGLRYTDEIALQAATMVLAGAVGTRVVAALEAGGVEALGMTGIDRSLMMVRRAAHPEGDLGFVGEPSAVRATLLFELLAAGVVPVLAPICGDGSGQAYNVNADVFAGAIAAAVGAEEAVFVSNVPGVLVADHVAPKLDTAAVETLIGDGTISGGMLPKVESALAALRQGVSSVRITNIGALDGGTAIER